MKFFKQPKIFTANNTLQQKYIDDLRKYIKAAISELRIPKLTAPSGVNSIATQRLVTTLSRKCDFTAETIEKRGEFTKALLELYESKDLNKIKSKTWLGSSHSQRLQKHLEVLTSPQHLDMLTSEVTSKTLREYNIMINKVVNDIYNAGLFSKAISERIIQPLQKESMWLKLYSSTPIESKEIDSLESLKNDLSAILKTAEGFSTTLLSEIAERMTDVLEEAKSSAGKDKVLRNNSPQEGPKGGHNR